MVFTRFLVLNDEAVEEYRVLHEKEFGEKISFGDARLRMNQVLYLYAELAMRPRGEASKTIDTQTRNDQ